MRANAARPEAWRPMSLTYLLPEGSSQEGMHLTLNLLLGMVRAMKAPELAENIRFMRSAQQALRVQLQTLAVERGQREQEIHSLTERVLALAAAGDSAAASFGEAGASSGARQASEREGAPAAGRWEERVHALESDIQSVAAALEMELSTGEEQAAMSAAGRYPQASQAELPSHRDIRQPSGAPLRFARRWDGDAEAPIPALQEAEIQPSIQAGEGEGEASVPAVGQVAPPPDGYDRAALRHMEGNAPSDPALEQTGDVAAQRAGRQDGRTAQDAQLGQDAAAPAARRFARWLSDLVTSVFRREVRQETTQATASSREDALEGSGSQPSVQSALQPDGTSGQEGIAGLSPSALPTERSSAEPSATLQDDAASLDTPSAQEGVGISAEGAEEEARTDVRAQPPAEYAPFGLTHLRQGDAQAQEPARMQPTPQPARRQASPSPMAADALAMRVAERMLRSLSMRDNPSIRRGDGANTRRSGQELDAMEGEGAMSPSAQERAASPRSQQGSAPSWRDVLSAQNIPTMAGSVSLPMLRRYLAETPQGMDAASGRSLLGGIAPLTLLHWHPAGTAEQAAVNNAQTQGAQQSQQQAPWSPERIAYARAASTAQVPQQEGSLPAPGRAPTSIGALPVLRQLQGAYPALESRFRQSAGQRAALAPTPLTLWMPKASPEGPAEGATQSAVAGAVRQALTAWQLSTESLRRAYPALQAARAARADGQANRQDRSAGTASAGVPAAMDISPLAFPSAAAVRRALRASGMDAGEETGVLQPLPSQAARRRATAAPAWTPALLRALRRRDGQPAPSPEGDGWEDVQAQFVASGAARRLSTRLIRVLREASQEQGDTSVVTRFLPALLRHVAADTVRARRIAVLETRRITPQQITMQVARQLRQRAQAEQQAISLEQAPQAISPETLRQLNRVDPVRPLTLSHRQAGAARREDVNPYSPTEIVTRQEPPRRYDPTPAPTPQAQARAVVSNADIPLEPAQMEKLVSQVVRRVQMEMRRERMRRGIG